MPFLGTYTSGRTALFSFAGGMQGTAWFNAGTTIIPGDPPQLQGAREFRPTLIGNCPLVGRIDLTRSGSNFVGGTLAMLLSVALPDTSAGTVAKVGAYVVTDPFTTQWGVDLAGNYSIEGTYEEVYISTDYLTTFSGEGLTKRILEVKWRPVVGTQMRYSVLCNGETFAGSKNVAPYTDLVYKGAEKFTTQLDVGITGHSAKHQQVTTDHSADAGISGSLLDSQNPIHYSQTDGSATVRNDGTSVYARLHHSNHTSGDCSIDSTWAPDKRIHFECMTRTPGGHFSFPVGYEVEIKQVGGILSFLPFDSAIDSQGRNMLTIDDVQRYHSVTGGLHGVTIPPTTLDERAAVAAQIRNGWLSANSENVNNWRTLILGRPFDGMTLSQAGTVVVDAGGSASLWSAVSNSTVTVAGGTVTIAVAGGTGEAKWTQVQYMPYRYLQITLRSRAAANQTFRVRMTFSNAGNPDSMTTKYWNITTGAADSYVTRTIDLCYPENITAVADNVDWFDDNRVTPDPGLSIADDDGPMWGVDRVAQIFFDTLANGITYDITSIKLVRQDHCRVNVMPAFDNGLLLHGLTDWRHSLEINGRAIHIGTTNTDVGGIVNQIGTTTAIIQNVGWTAGTVGGSVDGYHNSTLDAECLLGGGIAYYSGDWHYGSDVDCSVTQTIKAQSLWDQITFPPNSGDMFFQNDGTQSPVCAVRARKIIRGQAYGIVYDQSGNPLAGAQVSLQDRQTGEFEGIGYTDGYGGYKTDFPWGRTARDHNVIVHVGDSFGTVSYFGISSFEPFWYSGKRHRACFRPANATGDWIDRDVSRAGRQGRVFAFGGTIQIGFSSDVDGKQWSDTATTIAGTRPMCRYRRDKSSQLWLSYENSGTLYSRYTENEGGTFSVAGTISGTASFHDFALAPQGRYHYYLAGGTIFCMALDWAGGTLIAGTSVQTGVDTNAIAVRDYTSRNGVWNVGLTYRSSGNLISKSSTDGVNFS